MDYAIFRINTKTKRVDEILRALDYNICRGILTRIEAQNKNRLYIYQIKQITDGANVILYETPTADTNADWQLAHELITNYNDGMITLFDFMQEIRQIAERLPANNPWLYY